MWSMSKIKHWQDPANGLLGVWLALSPWLMQYAHHNGATANMLIVSVLLVATSFGATITPRAWEEWLEAALGAWLVVSPWVVGFSSQSAAMSTAVLTGALVLALALWTLVTDKDMRHLTHGSAH